MLLESNSLLGAREQIAANALCPVHLGLPRCGAVIARQQDRVRHVAIPVDKAAQVELAIGERGNLDLLHGYSWWEKGVGTRPPMQMQATATHAKARYIRQAG